MAKSGKPSISLIVLAVLALAVSLDAAHRVSAAGAGFISIKAAAKVAARLTIGFKKWLADHPKLHKAPSELMGKIQDFGDVITAFIEGYNKYLSSPALPPGVYYIKATGIMVDGGSSLGEGSVILILNVPFLNKQAYGLLKEKLPEGWYEKSVVGDLFQQLCYAAGTKLPLITLDLAANDFKWTNFWHEQSEDGSVCLGILS